MIKLLIHLAEGAAHQVPSYINNICVASAYLIVYDTIKGPKFVVIELHMAPKDLNFRLMNLPMSQVE